MVISREFLTGCFSHSQLGELNKQLANTAAAAAVPKPMTPECAPAAADEESYAITPEQPEEEVPDDDEEEEEASSFLAAVVAAETAPSSHVGEADADALFAAAAAIASS